MLSSPMDISENFVCDVAACFPPVSWLSTYFFGYSFPGSCPNIILSRKNTAILEVHFWVSSCLHIIFPPEMVHLCLCLQKPRAMTAKFVAHSCRHPGVSLGDRQSGLNERDRWRSVMKHESAWFHLSLLQIKPKLWRNLLNFSPAL